MVLNVKQPLIVVCADTTATTATTTTTKTTTTITTTSTASNATTNRPALIYGHFANISNAATLTQAH